VPTVKPREVPQKQAEKFLEGVTEDPKFLRFQRRQELSSTVTVLRAFAHRARAQRGIAVIGGSFFIVTALVIRLWPALALSLVGTTALWWWFTARVIRLDQSAHAISQEIADIDREASSSIKIIDPDTFGAPAPQLSKAQEA
jgi:hypothetical protein